MIVVLWLLLGAVVAEATWLALAEREIDHLDGDLWTTRKALDSACADLRLVDEHRAAHADRLDPTFGGQP